MKEFRLNYVGYDVKKYEITVDYETAFKMLDEAIKAINSNSATENYYYHTSERTFDDKAISYMKEWLFDCVHCTGYVSVRCIDDIINSTLEDYDEIFNESGDSENE